MPYTFDGDVLKDSHDRQIYQEAAVWIFEREFDIKGLRDGRQSDGCTWRLLLPFGLGQQKIPLVKLDACRNL